MGAFRTDSGMISPYAAAGAGALAGGGAVVVGQRINSALSRGSWALGLGVVLGGLSLVSSSDLNSAQTAAANLQTQAQALSIDATSATTLGASVAAMRNLMISGFQNQAVIAYGANWWAFNGTPPVANLGPTSPTAAVYGPATQTTTAATSNNTALIVLVIAAVALIGLVVFN